MKKILGLDLGSASIGWAVISEENDLKIIESLGSRVVPLSIDEITEFTRGNGMSNNASRTQRRTLRKGYDRFRQRKKLLTDFLIENKMLPDDSLTAIEKLELWGLRAKSVSEQLTLPQIGRVLYHINQKRGYKSVREDNADKSQKTYVENIIKRHNDLKNSGLTIGQKFFDELGKEFSYRVKEQIFPRKAYMDEFDKIIECQKRFYPTVFTEDNIHKLRNNIIYYQRGLKSCKHLVSMCDFEKRAYLNSLGETVFKGPNVTPRTSPLAQVCKIWESINNVTLRNRRGEELEITPAQRRMMFDHLDNHEKLSLVDLYRILRISKADGWWGGKAIGKGIQGNMTKLHIKKVLGEEFSELLDFRLSIENTDHVDQDTGEIITIVSDKFQDENLYKLWHLLYSIKDKEELAKVLKKRYGIEDQTIIDNLFLLDFVKAGYSNKSSKAMRRIIPYLELGLQYSDACDMAGFNHSASLTKEQNYSRELSDHIKEISRNDLRQPVVEKILNQMINVVNALMKKYGQFDEIRVELARELKQSRDERNETFSSMNRMDKLNKSIAETVFNEYSQTPTRSRIQKYRLWEESEHLCFYCGRPVGVVEFLKGFDVEVEHIIPRSLFFDDSFSNKVCACRKCNKEKNNCTAYDYMKTKSDEMFNRYVVAVETLYKNNKIGKTKYERLLTPGDKIPTDFIDRQLRESQYIARKSREILSSVCYNITSTSGSVTDLLRRCWGWDKVLHNLNFERYKFAGLTDMKERAHKGSVWSEEIIRDWSKRFDHRHHAIDALVIACTKQGYIQRLNNMSDIKDISFAPDQEQGVAYQERLTKLERYIISEPHFSTSDVEKAASSILISVKAGKKVATNGKRYIHRNGKRILVQRDIVIPRGALHEESLYGTVTVTTENKGKQITEKRSVRRYPITSIMRKDIDFIVDKRIRESVIERFDNHTGIEKDIWKDIDNNKFIFNGTAVRSITRFVRIKEESMASIDRGSVKLGNNHHIAIYIDKRGKRHEHCVTFWHAVERKQNGLPIVITVPDQVWDALPDNLAEKFMDKLPRPEWSLEVSMQQNEMFILGMDPEAFNEALRDHNYSLLSRYLYRVQSLSEANIWFRLHIETQNDKTVEGAKANKFYNIRSINGFMELNPQKVKISIIGEISKI